jgi:glycosyltransferase 2 family protein
VIRYWKLWLGLAISAVALFFTLRGIHFDEFSATLSRAQIIWLVPSCLMLLITLFLRTWRWSWLMGKTPFWTTFHALNIGYLLNSTLPFRLGEIGRAYVIGERTTVSMTRALSTVVVERMLDLSTIVLMFAAFTQFLPIPPEFSTAALTGGLVVVSLVAVFATAIWQSTRVEAWLEAITLRIPQLHAGAFVLRFRDLVDGFAIIRSPVSLAFSLLLTAGVWVASLLVAFFTMMAFKTARLDEVGLAVVLSNLGGALPSAPGGLGVVQFFAKQSLVIPFQVPVDIAVAFAFVWSLYQQLALIILGLIGLVRMGLSFANVSGSSRQVETGSPQVSAGK